MKTTIEYNKMCTVYVFWRDQSGNDADYGWRILWKSQYKTIELHHTMCDWEKQNKNKKKTWMNSKEEQMFGKKTCR